MMREAGRIVGRDARADQRAGAPRHHHRRTRSDRLRLHPLAGRRALVQGLQWLPRPRSAPRSTTRSCTASPGRGCCRRAISSASTVAPSTAATMATPRRRLAWATIDPAAQKMIDVGWEVALRGHQAGARRQPPGRHQRRPSRTCWTQRLRGRARPVGHGIGRRCTRAPTCPTSACPATACAWSPGIVLAIEPMLTQGSYEGRTLADDWTIVTARQRPRRPCRAHRRHHRQGPEILTVAPLARPVTWPETRRRRDITSGAPRPRPSGGPWRRSAEIVDKPTCVKYQRTAG